MPPTNPQPPRFVLPMVRYKQVLTRANGTQVFLVFAQKSTEIQMTIHGTLTHEELDSMVRIILRLDSLTAVHRMDLFGSGERLRLTTASRLVGVPEVVLELPEILPLLQAVIDHKNLPVVRAYVEREPIMYYYLVKFHTNVSLKSKGAWEALLAKNLGVYCIWLATPYRAVARFAQDPQESDEELAQIFCATVRRFYGFS